MHKHITAVDSTLLQHH